MMDPIFELEQIDYAYLNKYPALLNLNLQIRQGEKIAIIGANGSGKSTLLQLLDALIFAQKGRLQYRGKTLCEQDLFDETFSREYRRSVGLVFQNPDIQLFCPSVREDILFGPLQLGLGKNHLNDRFEKLAHILGIEKLLDRSPNQLSIGEKRKVAIASTLIIDPEVLILDEPTAGLDPQTTRNIIDLLKEQNQLGKTIITSTHDLHIVQEIADQIHVFSSEKTIVASGPPELLLKDTQLLHQHNLIHVHGHIHDGHIHVHHHTPSEKHFL